MISLPRHRDTPDLPHPGPRAVAVFVATVMAAIGLFAPAAPVVDVPPPEIPQIQAALAQIASGEAEAAARNIAEEEGLVANGAPCFMRHKRMSLGVDQAFRHRFAAATLATDPRLKDRLMETLAQEAPPGLPKWRVMIGRAELAARSGRDDAVGGLVDQAAAQNVPPVCRADEAFLRAITATPAEAAALLDIAVVADPGYWAAQESLALLAAAGTGSSAADCDADAARTIRSATQLVALAKMDVQFQRMERALDGMQVNARVALLRGIIRGSTDRAVEAVQIWREGLASLGDAQACDTALRAALEGMIANAEVDT